MRREQCSLRQSLGLPQWLRGKEPTCQCRRHKRLRLNPWVGKIRWRRKWLPTPVLLPGEPHGQRGDWRAMVHRIKESNTIEATYHLASPRQSYPADRAALRKHSLPFPQLLSLQKGQAPPSLWGCNLGEVSEALTQPRI